MTSPEMCLCILQDHKNVPDSPQKVSAALRYVPCSIFLAHRDAQAFFIPRALIFVSDRQKGFLEAIALLHCVAGPGLFRPELGQSVWGSHDYRSVQFFLR